MPSCFSLGIISLVTLTQAMKSGWNLPSKRYVVSTNLNAPWVTENVQENVTLCDGFVIDLLTAIGKEMNFQIKMSYGFTKTNVDLTTEVHNDVMAELVDGSADIGVVDLGVTENVFSVMSSTKPFVSTGMQIVLKKPLAKTRTWTLLLKPFSTGLWYFVVGAIVISCFVFFQIERRTSRHAVGFRDTVVSVCGLLLFQGLHRRPLPLAKCVLMCSWWMYGTCILLCYVSSLITYLQSTSIDKPLLPFTTFGEMADQTDVGYGGPTSLRLNQDYELHRKLNQYMTSHYTYYTDASQAVERVKSSDGTFAVIVDSLVGEHLINKHCDLMMLQDNLQYVHYGFACSGGQHGEYLCANLSYHIERLREDGTLAELWSNWRENPSPCPLQTEKDFINAREVNVVMFTSLKIEDAGLGFGILTLGIVISTSMLLIEKICRRYTRTDEKETGNKAAKPSNEVMVI